MNRGLVIGGLILAIGAGGGYAWWANQQRDRALRLEQLESPGATAKAHSGNPSLYKWKDPQGQWHITDRPPAQGPFERVEVSPDTNVVPSLPLTAVAPETPAH